MFLQGSKASHPVKPDGPDGEFDSAGLKGGFEEHSVKHKDFLCVSERLCDLKRPSFGIHDVDPLRGRIGRPSRLNTDL